MPPVKTLNQPPSAPSIPYHIPPHLGELWTIPTSNSTMRLLVTGECTSNTFAVVGTGGTYDRPIGFHYHREAHDVFLCLSGTLNIWANDQARSLGPGDFASVPPGTIHQYQIASAHTEFVGLIVPGGWEEFFRFVGEKYEGPLFPTNDKRNPMEVLVPKLIEATEKFDMVPVRDKEHFEPQPWDGSEEDLPGKCENGGYFLKAGKGKCWMVGGMVVRPLATRKETDGKFSIYEMRGSVMHAGMAPEENWLFGKTHHAFQTVEGHWSLVLEEEKTNVASGETVFVPAGMRFSLVPESVYVRGYLFANGGGLGEVLNRVGKAWEGPTVPEVDEVEDWHSEKLKGVEKEVEDLVL